MECERRHLQELERQHYKTEQMLENSTSKDEEEELLEQYQHEQEILDHKRKLFDDLEFTQLEVNTFSLYERKSSMF